MDRGLELHRAGARTLRHMPTPIVEILNTEGLRSANATTRNHAFLSQMEFWLLRLRLL